MSEITSFSIHSEIFRYNRLIFGLKCEFKLFQKIFGKSICKFKDVFNYTDIAIWICDPEKHISAYRY